MSTDGRWPAEWLRGVLEVCVLTAVADGSDYGYAISARLAEAGLGAVKGGTLYPLLGRLENDGLLVSSWEAGDGGPGRKVVRLTPAGLAELGRRAALWQDFTRCTNDLITPHAATAAHPPLPQEVR